MRCKSRHRLESGKAAELFVHLPNITLALNRMFNLRRTVSVHEDMTLLLPATRHEPSEASDIDLIGTSPAGVLEGFEVSIQEILALPILTSSCEQILSVKSHCFILPA